MSLPNVEQKKEDFKKYVESTGVIDAFTKVLVGLYEEPEKPDNPLEFVKQFLGGGGEVDVEALKRENDELKKKVSDLETQLNDLKTRGATSAALAPPAETPAPPS